MISQALAWWSYGLPYLPAKWYAHAVWFLDDTGVEGHVFADYFMGGFLGYWVAPELRAAVNGTLNVSSETLDAARALRERRGAAPGESFLDLLDRQRIDVFVGIRMPEAGSPNRPWDYTTAHLEGEIGWIPVFRNLRSAVYLRADERNAANLERVVAYYEKVGVPFDPARGFDAWQVVRHNRTWALTHGLLPVDVDRIENAARGSDLELREIGRDRLASLYAALGVYEQTVRIDRLLLDSNPDAGLARRRLVWSLLRLGRIEEAAAEADALEAAGGDVGLVREITATARAAAAGDPDASTRIALLPLFTRDEAETTLIGFVPPPVRLLRRP
jgi:hypothetical protein